MYEGVRICVCTYVHMYVCMYTADASLVRARFDVNSVCLHKCLGWFIHLIFLFPERECVFAQVSRVVGQQTAENIAETVNIITSC
jgi:hypothetical protein